MQASDTYLVAKKSEIDGWHVEDPAGGIWWPSDEASEQIESTSDPASESVRICRETPMRGTWHC